MFSNSINPHNFLVEVCKDNAVENEINNYISFLQRLWNDVSAGLGWGGGGGFMVELFLMGS
jgi:hypothetical protein